MVPWEEAVQGLPKQGRWAVFRRLVHLYWRLWNLPPILVFFATVSIGVLLILIAMRGPIGTAQLLVKQTSTVLNQEVSAYRSKLDAGRYFVPQATDAVLKLRDDVYLVDTRQNGFEVRPILIGDTASSRGSHRNADLLWTPLSDDSCLHRDSFRHANCQLFFLKDVGYLNALNWSLALALLFPAILWFAFRVPQLFHGAIEQMNAKGMFPDQNLRKPKGGQWAQIDDVRHKTWQRATLIGTALFALNAAVMTIDWYTVVYEPTACVWSSEDNCEDIWKSPDEDDFQNELDWSVYSTFGAIYARFYDSSGDRVDKNEFVVPFSNASPISQLFRYYCVYSGLSSVFNKEDCPNHQKLSTVSDKNTIDQENEYHSISINLKKENAFYNILFALFAYGVAIVLAGIVLAFYGYLAAVAWTMEEVSAGRFGRVVLPDVDSMDRRFGFQHLWMPIRAVLMATLLGYLVLFLMRVQNLFLRAQSYHDIYAYMLEDVLKPLKDIPLVIEGLLKGKVDKIIANEASSTPQTMGNILDPGLEDTQALFALAVFFCVIVVMAALLIFALRDVAERAKRDALDLLEDAERRESYLRLVDRLPTAATSATADVDQAARALRDHLQTMITWPLAWPPLRRTLRLLLIGVVFLIFYRAVFIWLGLFLVSAVTSIFGRDRSLRRQEENLNRHDPRDSG